MAPTILCLGLSHRTAPLVLREQFTCSLNNVALLAAKTRRELVLLATCNRIELYAALETPALQPKAYMAQLLSKVSGLNQELFADYTYLLLDEKAISHLLRVAAGLESLILGEPQILGQVSKAFRLAADLGAAGPILRALFQSAVRAGKRARTETVINQNSTGVGSIAVNLAQQILGELSDRRILIVGAGEMGQLAVKAVRHRGLAHVAVANRTRARAQEIVAGWNGRSYGLEQLADAIAAADLVITTARTGAPLIDKNTIIARERPLVIVDIALPRNVAPSLAALPHIQLFNLDDLQTNLEVSLSARQAEVPAVEGILCEEQERLASELRQLAVKPLIVDMRRRAEKIRQKELERTLRHIGDLDPQTLSHVRHLSRSLVNKLLHEPTLRLREAAGDEAADIYEAAVRTLFNLSE